MGLRYSNPNNGRCSGFQLIQLRDLDLSLYSGDPPRFRPASTLVAITWLGRSLVAGNRFSLPNKTPSCHWSIPHVLHPPLCAPHRVSSPPRDFPSRRWLGYTFGCAKTAPARHHGTKLVSHLSASVRPDSSSREDFAEALGATNSVTANNVLPMNRATAKNGTLIRAKLIPPRIATNSLLRARLVSGRGVPTTTQSAAPY